MVVGSTSVVLVLASAISFIVFLMTCSKNGCSKKKRSKTSGHRQEIGSHQQKPYSPQQGMPPHGYEASAMQTGSQQQYPGGPKRIFCLICKLKSVIAVMLHRTVQTAFLAIIMVTFLSENLPGSPTPIFQKPTEYVHAKVNLIEVVITIMAMRMLSKHCLHTVMATRIAPAPIGADVSVPFAAR